MPLYRNLKKDGLAVPLEPTRLIARRPAPGAKARSRAAQTVAAQVEPAVAEAAQTVAAQAEPAVAKAAQSVAAQAPAVAEIATDLQSGAVVGWLVVISGPGRGQILTLHYGVNDIGRGDKARIRLNFGDTFIAVENQAAIIYTARSRRFYFQGITAETWLDERPAQGLIELVGGETLQLGQTRLRFVPLCGLDFDWRDTA